MALRLATSHVPDLLTRSDIRVLAPGGLRTPNEDTTLLPRLRRRRQSRLVAEGTSPYGRWMLRLRGIQLLLRTGMGYAAGGTAGLLAGWIGTALWVLAH